MTPYAYDPGRDVFYAWTLEEAQYALLQAPGKKVVCIDEPMCLIVSTISEAALFYNRPSITVSVSTP